LQESDLIATFPHCVVSPFSRHVGVVEQVFGAWTWPAIYTRIYRNLSESPVF